MRKMRDTLIIKVMREIGVNKAIDEIEADGKKVSVHTIHNYSNINRPQLYSMFSHQTTKKPTKLMIDMDEYDEVIELIKEIAEYKNTSWGI